MALRLKLLALLASTGCVACSSSDQSGSASSTSIAVPPTTPAPVATISSEEAFRFLTQSTFGATPDEVGRLKALGNATTGYQRWIDQQMQIPASLTLPDVQAADPAVLATTGGWYVPFRDAWFRHAVAGPDQLRQRVAFALSEIFVVSFGGMPFASADYYDLLARSAFGDFRQLLQDVTLHPAMGAYLSMLGNRKADEASNIRPDENFAREVLQLFSIGLVELNPDGTIRTDSGGEPVPTYDQEIVEGFAAVFTGWNFAGAPSFKFARLSVDSQLRPMQAYPEEHSTASKRLLSYPGVTKTELPAGQTAEQDLADALDNIFHHPNVGPFISRQLIQRLVTSNPSPGYVGRVAAKFNDDGTGRRGNLAAVVRAILLDPEARSAQGGAAPGKVKEPLLRVTQLWRAYGARSEIGQYRLRANYVIGQLPLQSPSVFNFFRPDFAPSGEIAEAGLAAPELQIATEHLSATTTTTLADLTLWWNSSRQGLPVDAAVLDISAEMAVADQPGALIDMIAGKLLGGRISASLRTSVEAAIGAIPVADRGRRAGEAIFLIASSPEFAVQR